MTTTTPRPATTPDPERLPAGNLLAWGEDHADPEVNDQAARARLLLAGLRQRYAADYELAAVTTEAEQLEKRLAELRAREAELQPPTKTKSRRSGQARVVRAWAREAGVDCPPVGVVPKHIVEQWQQATGGTAGA